MSLARLTTSRAKAARACLRLHHLQYELGYRPLNEGDAVRFGSLWHLGLQDWFGATPGLRLDAALGAIAEACRGDEVDLFARVTAEELLRGYDCRWDDEGLETLAVEREFQAPMVNPATGAASRTWMLAGKIDALVRRSSDGRTLIVEHKTTSEDMTPGGEYWRRLRLDGQIGAYFAGARALGFDVSGCLYDVARKPGLRPLKATPPEARKYTQDGRLYASQRENDETPEEYRERLREDVAGNPARYFARGDVVRLEEEMADYLHDIWQLGRVIRESEVASRWPRNPDACVRYGQTCQYFDVCTGVASLDDETRFRRVTNVHPELSLETPADAA